MGTRNLTLVKQRGQYRVAQYGQWDGYPSGQGAKVLKFLKQWDRPLFERKVSAASFITSADAKALNAQIKAANMGSTWPEKWPELSRDTAAEVLQIIADRPDGIKLKNSTGFAGDSLFCEWAYVIDLDTNQLEVLRGFNKTPLVEGDRFHGVPDLEQSGNAEYHPVRKVASYDLGALPSQEQMEADCSENESD